MAIFHSITEYLKAKNAYEQAPLICNNDGIFVKVRGNWIPFSEYQKHNTKPEYNRPPLANPDGTKCESVAFPSKKQN